MRKALIISLIICVLAAGGIGAALATGMEFNNVGALSLGTEAVPQIDVSDVGWNLRTGTGEGVVVCDVELTFVQDVPKGTLVFVSLRSYEGNSELAYAAEVIGPLSPGNPKWFPLWDTSDVKHGDGLPSPEAVDYIKVTVAGNGHYLAGGVYQSPGGPPGP